MVQISSEAPPTYDHVKSHSSEVSSCILFPTYAPMNNEILPFTEGVDPQEENLPNKNEHGTSLDVNEGELLSEEAPVSLRCSVWICYTLNNMSLAGTNCKKTNTRTHDTASWNGHTKHMTVESHLPTQQAQSDATSAQTSHRFPHGGCIADTVRRAEACRNVANDLALQNG